MKSATISVRMAPDLSNRLERAARQFKLGKNAIITLALDEYLEKLNPAKFLEEARRQSLLASASAHEDEEIWIAHADMSGWK